MAGHQTFTSLPKYETTEHAADACKEYQQAKYVDDGLIAADMDAITYNQQKITEEMEDLLKHVRLSESLYCSSPSIVHRLTMIQQENKLLQSRLKEIGPTIIKNRPKKKEFAMRADAF